jgi:hypothetical protein
VSRVCARPGCPDAAVATLTYDYAGRSGWLDPLADERHPMSYDLCSAHAEALTVPRGWALEDRREGRRSSGDTAEGALAS